jgi:hypothetical protein
VIDDLVWCALDFKIQLNRFANAYRHFVQRARLRVTTLELRDGRTVITFLSRSITTSNWRCNEVSSLIHCKRGPSSSAGVSRAMPARRRIAWPLPLSVT